MTSSKWRIAAAVLGMTVLSASHAGEADGRPPLAPVRDVTQVLHGVTVHDPYRYMEDLKDPQTRAWLEAQGAYAARALAALPQRDALAARIEELQQSAGDSIDEVVRMPGERLFYLKRSARESQYKLVVRTGLNGPERVLVDPQALARAKGVPFAINYFVPSWDGRYVAYGMSAGGSEDASLHVIEVASGRQVGQPIPRVHENLVHWTPDSRSLTYNQLRKLPAGAPDTETYLDSTVYLLRVGDAPGKARPLFGPLVNTDLKLERLDVSSIEFDPTSRFMVARTTDTTVPEGRIYVAPVADLRHAHIGWRPIATRDDEITDLQLYGRRLYLRSRKNAPHGKWLALDLARGDGLDKAATVIAEPAHAVLQRIVIRKGGTLDAEVSQGFETRLMRFASPDAAGVDVAGSGAGVDAGSSYAVGDPAHAFGDAWFVSSTWTQPARILKTSGPGGAVADTGLLATQMPKGAPALKVSEVLVTSHDGAQVPLAIIHRADLTMDAPHPTLLEGYGSYGFSYEAYFSATSIAWLERGGVLAYANVRGSGAFGDEWHRAGFKTTKPNTWKDGIACAKYLIDKGYASPKTLAVEGGSAGGIFVGRAVTEAPELFAAAIFEVGMLDTIRSEESANGITNISEFGTVKDPVEFKALLEMSTYAHIRDGVKYPGILLVHGMNDPRVDVWESAKTAARLQAAAPQGGRPVLLRLDAQSGHGIGSTATQRAAKQADEYAFLLSQFELASP